MFLPPHLAQHTVESLYADHGRRRPGIYSALLIAVVALLICLPLIELEVSVQAPGMVRPATERVLLRSGQSGRVADVLAHDNERVVAGQPLVLLATDDLDERARHTDALLRESQVVVADLERLLQRSEEKGEFAEELTLAVPALQQELRQYLAQRAAGRLAESRARGEAARAAVLAGKGIATQQELDATRYEVERLQAELSLLAEQTFARWQNQLRQEQLAAAERASSARRIREERTLATVRAPATGVLLGFGGWQKGSFLSAGQELGEISPDDTLQVEAYVRPEEVGLVRVGQVARLRIDAYPAATWGTWEGKVTAIGADWSRSAPRSAPAFKVIIRPTPTKPILHQKRKGELKKGLTLSARFVVGRRSLFELLREGAGAWLDPREHRPT